MKTALTGILMALAVAAQQQPAGIAFEAVSVKPADPADPAHMTQTSQGGFRGRNLRLFELVMSAWRLNRNQIVGGPNWLETTGWDIDARFPQGATRAQLPQMMQAMLADRFGLVTHLETRALPAYALVVAKGGPKLSPGDTARGMSAGPRMIRYGSATMSDLASQLSGYLGRNVTDRTDLTGQYSIDLSFAPTDPGASSDDPAPSLFQALQDQAGLKLESVKAPVEVLVIDHAATPAAN
jgi:uncharacterized protein (TIGR03435 family)